MENNSNILNEETIEPSTQEVKTAVELQQAARVFELLQVE
jgi:hypothetical protein